MKRFFLISFVAVALLGGGGGRPPPARAQPSGTPTAEEQAIIDQQSQFSNDDDYGPAQSYETAYETTPEYKAAANTQKPYNGDTTTAGFFAPVMQEIMKLFAWLVGVAAITLDTAVYYTVVNMGTYVHNLAAVGVAWRILRDIGNIIIIFGFLAIGITTIMNVGWYGGGTKMLPMLLISAVFLNFSLFFAEAVIDSGNLVATQFYTQINGGDPAGAKSFDPGFSIRVRNEGISDKIMGQLGLQTIYNAGKVNPSVFTYGNSLLIGFMGIILFLATAFTLFALAFLLISRFVRLLYLIILAPVGFAGLAVPKLKTMANKWWKDLFDQTISAPVLFLLLYIALAVITDAQFLTGLGGGGKDSSDFWVGFIANGDLPGFASVILSFLVAIGMLLYVVTASKQLSAFGADWAAKTAGKLSFSTTAWAGRTTGGFLASKGANLARKTWIGRVPLAGTGLVRGLDKIASSSFDVRGIKTLGGLKGGIGIDAGEAQKGGYKADLKAGIESRTKYASELKGKELDADKKAERSLLQNEIKRQQKNLAKARTVNDAKTAQDAIKTAQDAIDDIESVTDKGAQRKYAKALDLGMDEKSTFNKYFNFAANTEAAKKIRAEAKKSSNDRNFDEFKKAFSKGGGGGTTGGGTTGGGATGGGTTGGPGP